jgi:hypothetical protein
MAEHGPAAPVLRTGELLKDTFKCKLPESEYSASNARNPSVPVNIYVNGFVGSKEYYDPSLQKIANTMGFSVLGVINNQELGIGIDLSKAVAGRMHSALGKKAENIAITNLKDCILDFHKNFPEKDIRLLAYSQGTIITKNAIESLKKELPEADWSSLSRKLRIELYGAAQHRWPSELSVVEFMHKKDYVPGLTQIPDAVRHNLHAQKVQGSPFQIIEASGVIDGIPFKRVPSIIHGNVKTPEMVILDTQKENPHDIQGYMESQAYFFIVFSGDPGSPKGIDTTKVADRLAGSIKYAWYSDPMHNEVISKLVHDQAFAEKLLQHAPYGWIDGYQIPVALFDQLRSSAGGRNSLEIDGRHLVLPSRP